MTGEISPGQRYRERAARVERTVLVVSKSDRPGNQWLVRCVEHSGGGVGRRSFISEDQIRSRWVPIEP